MADPRASRAFGVLAGVGAIAAGAFLAVRPFAAPEVMALCASLGLAVGALVELVQLSRLRPAKLTLAIGFTVASVLVWLWQPVSLPLIGAVIGVLLILAGGAELWSAALISNQNWPRLLNSPSRAGFWPSLLVGGAWIVLGSLAAVWVDRTLLPMAVVLGIYLLVAGGALLSDAVAPVPRPEAASRLPLVGRLLAVALGSGLAVAGIGLDDGRPAPGPFYSSAAVSGHAAGKLLRAEPYSGGTVPGVVGARLLYVTTASDGRPAVASAVVYVPADRVTEQLPLVVWVHDGGGLAPSCAPSVRGLSASGLSLLDRVAAAGYAVLAPDLPGLGVEGEPSYLLGQPEAHAVLDGLRAARQLNGVRFSGAVLWGFGQGGHAVLWAGSVRDEYAPEVSLDGVAALAPFTDLAAVFSGSGGGPGRELAESSLIGSYSQAYPEVDFDSYVAPSAWLRVREAAARCDDRPGPLLPWLRALDHGSPWLQSVAGGPLGARLDANRPDGRIRVPVFVAQGDADQLISRGIQDDYVADQCRRGTGIDYRVYRNRDHDGLITRDSPAVSDMLAWSADRLAGLRPLSTCS